MADPVDLSDIQNEAAHTAALKVRKPEGPKAVGHCLYCKCSLPVGMRWCDSGCQHDWELEEAAIARNGGRRG